MTGASVERLSAVEAGTSDLMLVERVNQLAGASLAVYRGAIRAALESASKESMAWLRSRLCVSELITRFLRDLMTRPRLTIAQLMILILLVGLGFAALRNANELWSSAMHTLAIISISAAPLGAFARKGKARMTWAGFAVFGWCYFLSDLLPDLSGGSLGVGAVRWPGLIIDVGAAVLPPFIHPLAPGVFDRVQYYLVSRSLGIILFGIVGAA